MSEREDDFAELKEALLFSTRNLGRLGQRGGQEGDDEKWKVPDTALAALARIRAHVEALEGALRAHKCMEPVFRDGEWVTVVGDGTDLRAALAGAKDQP